MTEYAWPGNIRELQNCIERAVIVTKSGLIDEGDLPHYLFTAQPAEPDATRFPLELDEELARLEQKILSSLPSTRRTVFKWQRRDCLASTNAVYGTD